MSVQFPARDTQDQYFVALQLDARALRRDGAVRQRARGRSAATTAPRRGGGLPPSRATREQDAAGAGALNCFHHHVGRRKIAGCRQGFSRCASLTIWKMAGALSLFHDFGTGRRT